MTASELIRNTVNKEYREKAHVRAIIDSYEWWHVHRDEELPESYPCIVYVRP